MEPLPLVLSSPRTVSDPEEGGNTMPRIVCNYLPIDAIVSITNLYPQDLHGVATEATGCDRGEVWFVIFVTI